VANYNVVLFWLGFCRSKLGKETANMLMSWRKFLLLVLIAFPVVALVSQKGTKESFKEEV
jgi:hypothetical protein